MDEHPEKTCPMCAGTGKVRDYHMDITPNSVGTYFTIDPEVLKFLDCTPIYGT